MNTPQHILHLSKYYPPFKGGLEKVVQYLAEGTATQGHSVGVLCFDTQRSQSERINNVHIIRVKQRLKLASAPLSLSYLQQFQQLSANYRCIHMHHPNPIANAAVTLYAKPFHTIVLHWHSDIIKQKSTYILYKPLLDKLLKRANVIVATSKNYATASSELMPYQHKTHIVPIGIDAQHPPNTTASTAVTRIQQQYRNKKIVFTVGRHVYYKGFEYLINAAAYLPRHYHVIIAGEGKLTAQYQQQIQQLTLNKQVTLVGKLTDHELSHYYQAADLFCLPSIEKSEAFGVVLLEAMKYELPLVCFHIAGSGVPWVNLDQKTGRVVKNKCPQALAKAIIEVGEKGKLFYRDQLNIRLHQQFTKDIMIKRMTDIYQSTIPAEQSSTAHAHTHPEKLGTDSP